MPTVTTTTTAPAQTGVLSCRSHLRICRRAVLAHRLYLVYALLFPVLVIILAGDGAVYRLSAVILLALLPTGLLVSTALTGEQLRAFGMVTADQRRHRRTMIGVTAVFCVIDFVVYSVVNAVTTSLGDGLPWWCLGAAAVLAVVLLVVRAIPSGASGDTPVDGKELPGRGVLPGRGAAAATGTDAGTPHGRRGLVPGAVRRTWRPVLWSICALVTVQMLVRLVVPGAASTAVTGLMLIVGITALAAGGEQAALFRTVLVFGGSRSAWIRTVLREGVVLPLVGAFGAVAAMVMERVFVTGPGWADASALVTVHSPRDAVLIVLAGAASGVVVFLVGTASALADVWIPGWASILLVMGGSAAVVGLLAAVWVPGTNDWLGQWWTLTGGFLVCVLGVGVVAPLLAWLTSRCSLRADRGMSTWLGIRTRGEDGA